MAGKRSLKQTITVVISLLSAVVLFGVITLIILSSSLSRVNRSLGDSLEGVRRTEEAEIALLLHDRARSGLGRTAFETDVRRNLARAGRFVEGAAERAALDEALAAVDVYFRAVRQNRPTVDADLEQAFRAVDDLVEVNMTQARATLGNAQRMNRLANLIASISGGLFVLGAGWMIWWLYRRAFQPTLSLAAAMTRFAEGDDQARAGEAGPAELMEMSVRFNQLADALDRQRHREAAFLAGVAHDLRNPLAALRYATEVVKPGRELPAEDRIRQVFALVQRQVDRLDHMVKDFLDTARIRAGELELTIERHDLRELGRAVIDLFEPTTEDHTFVIELPEQPVWVDCDPYRMEQVVNNLVSNAIKYSPAGGEVSIAVQSEGGEGVFSVTDVGVGIAREAQEELFEPFRRAKLTGQELPGVGLGLFVAARIVGAHGGTIEVESVLGRGSTFTVRIPLAERPPQPT